MPRRCSAPLLLAIVALLRPARAAVVAPVTVHGPPTTPAVVTSAAYLSSETDVLDAPGWMRTLYGVQFDEAERRCASKDEVLYRPLGQCFALFRRGPCARYEWLVFDKQKAARGTLTVVCARRKCAPNWGYDAAANTCFEHTQCRKPLAFHYTLFGDGVCRCNGTTGGLAMAPPDDPASCYELYHHPPCRKGQMLAPRYRLIEGMDAMCFRDPCDGYKPPAGNASAPAHVVTTTASPPSSQAPIVKKGPPHVHREPLTPRPFDHHGGHPDHRGGNHPPHHPGHHGAGLTPGHPHIWRGKSPGGARPPPPRERESPEGEGPEGRVDFDVEVIAPNRPNLGVKTSTRAVVDSNNNSNAAASDLDHDYLSGHDHSDWSAHDHHGWSDHDHDDWPGHDHEYGHLQGRASAHVERRGPLNFTIRLKARSSEEGGRSRRGLPSTLFESRAPRNARGEPNARVDSDNTRSGHNSREGPNSKGTASQGNRAFDSTASAGNAQPSGREFQEAAGAANVTDDYFLEVQYSDGNTSCMSPSQLNVICDLQMVPLFSDFSDVKVPICVNALFRFAIGRVGKSDECAENDKGECAQKVVVKSAEPLDWELE